MSVKKIKSIVISKTVKKAEEVVAPSEEEPQKAGRTKKVCFFCQSKAGPSYTDTASLRRFTTDRSKIVPKMKSNLCSKHQRALTREIKYARHLSLLPFTPKV